MVAGAVKIRGQGPCSVLSFTGQILIELQLYARHCIGPWEVVGTRQKRFLNPEI